MDLYQASSLKGSTNTMISSPLKPHTNACTDWGRPTLNVYECFMQGSPRGLYERSIYERTFLSEPVKNLKNQAISNARRKTYTGDIQSLVACKQSTKTIEISSCQNSDVHSWICQKGSPSSRRYASCCIISNCHS